MKEKCIQKLVMQGGMQRLKKERMRVMHCALIFVLAAILWADRTGAD